MREAAISKSDLSNPSESFLLERLEYSLEKLQSTLAQHESHSVAPADHSYSLFSGLDPVAQEKIIENIDAYVKIIAMEPIPTPEKPTKNKRDVEVARLKKALREFGFKALDDEIFGQLNEDDVIEIYNDAGVQLYRNIRFCKLCAYSLLDLAVNSWDDLYQKPAAASKQIHAVVRQVLFTDVKTIPYNLGSFIQRERFIYTQTLKTFLVTPKFLSPLINSSGERRGFLSTYKANVVAQGSENSSLDIL